MADGTKRGKNPNSLKNLESNMCGFNNLELARKAGKKSGEARTMKKQFQEAMTDVLMNVTLNKDALDRLKAKGINVSTKEKVNVMYGILLGQAAEALNGNSQAARVCMDAAGANDDLGNIDKNITIKFENPDVEEFGD